MSDRPTDDELREMLPRLRRFALWLTRDGSGADDLVQATMERAITRWSGRRRDDALRAWLFAILYRKFLDGQRRAKRYGLLLERFRLGGDEPSSPSLEREVEAQSQLLALEQLPAAQRNLLLWVSVEGLSYQEVARILEVPVGTVMSRLSRARQALRRLGDGEVRVPALRALK